MLTISEWLEIFQLLAIVAGASVGLIRLSGFSFQMGQVWSAVTTSLDRQNAILQEHKDELSELRQESKAQLTTIAGVLTNIAVQDNRIDRVEADMREMKHGEGFVRPSGGNVPKR